MKWKFNIIKLLAYTGCAYVLLLLAALFGFVVSRGLPVLNLQLFFEDTPPLEAVLGLSPVWEGIWPATVGTLCLILLTMLFAALPGICCGIYLACFAKGRRAEYLSLAMDLLAGTPSIVMGLFGFVLVLLLRKTVFPQASTSILLSAFCLALLVMPALVTATRSSIESLPMSLKLTGESLGFTHGQLLRYLVIPSAARGIISGIMLAAGRAAEDTAVIMLTGVVINSGIPSGLTAKFEALPFRIYYTSAQYTDEYELMRGFGAAMVLLILSVLLVTVASLFQKSMERSLKGTEKYE